MADITHQFWYGGLGFTLTTGRAGAHDALPVVRHEGCPCPDMGPRDVIDGWLAKVTDLFGPLSAGELVYRCALLGRWPEDAYNTARAFLAQDPAGPQLPPFLWMNGDRAAALRASLETAYKALRVALKAMEDQEQ